jgi:hypothetical protein
VADDMSGATRKGLDNHVMSPEERRDDVLALAAAETKLFEARGQQVKATDAYMKEVDEAVKKQVEINEKLKKDREEQALRQAKDEQLKPFSADSMAQSGLFTGSSLLFNPGFNVQQQQLDVLRVIASNTNGNNMFSQ